MLVVGSDVIDLYEMDLLEVVEFLEKLLIYKDMFYDEEVVVELLKEFIYFFLVII